ncbi:26S proteasome non-ATPase regulatory subunit [Monosporozyma unispora]|nr:26S proteasome non-ATPase regulatory subunit [Kazachstania unispora]
MDVKSIINNPTQTANATSSSQQKFAQAPTVEQFVGILRELAKSNGTTDSRHVWRALNGLSALRKDGLLISENLSALCGVLYPDEDLSQDKKHLLQYINDNHITDVKDASKIRESYPIGFYQVETTKEGVPTVQVTPLINSFIHLLVQIYLLENDKIDQLNTFNKKIVLPNVLQRYTSGEFESSSYTNNSNRSSLDLINSKLWFYTTIGYERDETHLKNIPVVVSLRSQMMKFLKLATLKHDNETKAILIVSILRNFILLGEITLASDFVSKIEFPSNDVASSLEARYYFYLSKINAIQLNYSAANDYIVAAIRKAPHNKNSLGFLQQANKLFGVIQLLMGDIPELSFFHQEGMQQSLYPYYHLTNTVKLGDLNKFTNILTKFKKQLIKDDNYQLCVRLRSNVIKTGIRIISLTYKKISLKDICLKLSLDSEQTVEYMVSRSIRDGVIEANINHKDGYIETTEILNIYNTRDPQRVFDERIKFVNQLHDESMLAMRYPDDKKKNGNKKKGDDDNSMNNGDFLDDLSDLDDLDDLEFL